VESIARLFPRAERLLGSEASGGRLGAMARADRLRTFRYIHLATHGVLDDRQPLRSALLLAPDGPPDPPGRAPDGRTDGDGRVTAWQMLRDWKLDADLVTLSACRTGVGAGGEGEGHLGFAQALFLTGGRSLVLSLWEVDDTATALLMTRFYENLLGKRAGLAGPLPKARALREAKDWLRALKAEEVRRQVLRLPAGVRGQVRTRLNTDPGAPPPYAHPYYWSGFVLLGDPD
jgi:CHAT domain-containing protein